MQKRSGFQVILYNWKEFPLNIPFIPGITYHECEKDYIISITWLMIKIQWFKIKKVAPKANSYWP